MKTRALLLALPLLAVLSCRDNLASVQIQAVCMPTKTCLFGATCDAQFIGFPTVDAVQSGQLWLMLQVANQLPNNASSERGKLNTNDAHLDEVVVDYEGAPLPRDTYVLANQRVPAAGTAVVSVLPIRRSAATSAALAAFAPTAATRDMVANVRLRGYTDDGSRFETGEFPVSIHVCSSCVSGCPAGEFACPEPFQEPSVCGTTN
jgi:hypothetical protein